MWHHYIMTLLSAVAKWIYSCFLRKEASGPHFWTFLKEAPHKKCGTKNNAVHGRHNLKNFYSIIKFCYKNLFLKQNFLLRFLIYRSCEDDGQII